MLETYITQKIFKENYEENRESGIDSEEVVVILNPTQYTLKDEDAEDKAFEDQVVQSSLNDSRHSIVEQHAEEKDEKDLLQQIDNEIIEIDQH